MIHYKLHLCIERVRRNWYNLVGSLYLPLYVDSKEFRVNCVSGRFLIQTVLTETTFTMSTDIVWMKSGNTQSFLKHPRVIDKLVAKPGESLADNTNKRMMNEQNTQLQL